MKVVTDKRERNSKPLFSKKLWETILTNCSKETSSEQPSLSAWKMKWLGHTGMLGAIPVWPTPYRLQRTTKPLSLNRYGPHHTGMAGAIPV
jgi:hypothetical protein